MRRAITSRLRKGLLAAALAVALPAGAQAAMQTPTPPDIQWSFDGLFGTYDRAQLQRGFHVYSQVCASCHAASLLYYRNLLQIGMTQDQAAEVAAQAQVTDGPNDEGEMFQRPGRLSDRFVSPFPNEKAARAANSGAYPPDLSLINKARMGGADYVHGILVGYRDAPSDVQVAPGQYYNEFFPGHLIAMPPPLSEGAVDYPEGVPATVDQMAKDVTAFLQFAADPHLEERKRTGVKTILFLLVLTAMLYAVKRKVWADVH